MGAPVFEAIGMQAMADGLLEAGRYRTDGSEVYPATGALWAAADVLGAVEAAESMFQSRHRKVAGSGAVVHLALQSQVAGE